MTSTITTGSRVSLHYVGTLENGDVFDSSRERGEPLNVVTGVGQIIPGMDTELSESCISHLVRVRVRVAYATHLVGVRVRVSESCISHLVRGSAQG